MAPEAIIEEVKSARLWGRGGAAFSTGLKWECRYNAKSRPKYIIVNADEGDPGAFVNRNLLESDPHLLVEGVVIAGIATQADQAYIYIRDEYPLPIARTEKSVEQAYAPGLVGED